mgnify:CR=1 FL=1
MLSKVSEEVKELFSYIGRYKPHNIELETRLKPFVPEYIPAVGDIDEFLKVATHHLLRCPKLARQELGVTFYV